MRAMILAAVLAGLGAAAAPAEAGERGWSFGHLSAPAGARFHAPPPRFRPHAGMLRHRSFGQRDFTPVPTSRGFHDGFFDAPRSVERTVRHPGFATRRFPGPHLGPPPLFQPKRHDHWDRTVVIIRIDESPQVIVKIVPVPQPKPWHRKPWKFRSGHH